ncbi:MAG: hypothetical protein M0Z52_03815 [Actinomycetota bacterium]|nr:hypothetical protein [Actinomycetota bacterium]
MKAKVNGVHALSGLGLVAGEEYDIEPEHFGEEVFEKIGPDAPGESGHADDAAGADAVSIEKGE